MSGKYGFGIDLSKIPPEPEPRQRTDSGSLDRAVRAANNLGFFDREPTKRLKTGPKRREPQDKVSIPGPKRVTDEFREFCRQRDFTLWEGLELLLSQMKGRGS